MGMNVFVGGPPTCIPVGIESYGVTVVRDMREVIPQLDALIALRIQKERMSEELFPSEREYATHFGINEQSLANAKEDILVMHPGPVNRGVELSPEVIDGPRSVILDQVTNGVAIRMAVMYLLMGEKNRRAS
jgi:aspartate carbamoyltransferase catalytic subunit